MVKRIKIILIGGYGRSGSTLLDRILGKSFSVISTGELRHIWNRSLLDNQLCGCGKKFNDCFFWNTVINEYVEKTNALQTEEIIKLKQKVDRVREIPFHLFPKLQSKNKQKTFNQYTKVLLDLYKSIMEVSGCEYVVDSSKDVSYVYLLNSMAKQGLIDLFVIHLVRDSRAVAYSMRRKKRRPEIYWQEKNMPMHNSFVTSFEWAFSNVLVRMLKLFANARYYFLRYEDFVNYPDKELQNLYSFLKIEKNKGFFLEGESIVELDIAHTISGNPIRFSHGTVCIKLDDEWKENLSLVQRMLITFFTMPLLFLFNYNSKT